MNILHAIYSFNVGGAETMLVDIMNRQCKNASVNLLIINNKTNLGLLKSVNDSVKIFMLNREEGNKLQLLKAFCSVNKIVRELNPDIIHCHENNLFPFFFLSKRKTCLTVHNVNLSPQFVKQFSKVFVISEAVKRDVEHRTGKLTETVYNGIPVDAFKHRTDYGYDAEKTPFKIVMTSRLFPEQKGQNIAIEALSLLKKKFSKFTMELYFIGEGDALEELKKLALSKNLEDKVFFLGQKDRSWIYDHLSTFHLLIQPSLYEGFGLTVVEGFAAALPVIASNIDGPEEILSRLGAGLLVKAGDPKDLAEKIELVFNIYNSGKIAKSNYLIRDKKRLKVFDIQYTADTYMEKYKDNIRKYSV